MHKKAVTVVKLLTEHNIDDFNSGENILDEYLKRYAIENSNRGISQAWVGLKENELQEVVGYYTLSSAQLEHGDLSKKQQRGLPKYPIPSIRIGRLAIDKKMQGHRYGEALLFDALFRIVQVSSVIGMRYVIVDAKHENARQFYLKYGFVSLLDNPLKLILPIKTISKTLT